MIRAKATKVSWRFQSLIRLADSISEERLIHLCFEATDDEFDKAIEEYGGKVVRHKDNPNLTPVNGINIIETITEETPVIKGIWKGGKDNDTYESKRNPGEAQGNTNPR